VLRLLGYDVRERWCDRRRLWPEQRVQRFLLRTDIDKPLSTDVMVWPTVFADAQLDWLDLGDARIGSVGAPAPAFHGFVQDLWRDLAELERHVPQDLPAHDVIAITSTDATHPDMPSCSPATLDDHWILRGYDIADSGLLSGLSNCGFLAHEAEDAARLRTQWAGRLNRWHLFDDPTHASDFARLADARVPEHAPFTVYGIWARPARPIT
jgi:hypothetical protein